MGSLVALIVAGVIAAAAILVYVATVISLVILVAVAGLVAATGDLFRHFVFVRRYRSFVFFQSCLQPNGASRVYARSKYAPTRCLSSLIRFSLERQLD